MKLHYQISEPDSLGADCLDSMYALFASVYDGVSREMFDEDLSAKTWVVLLLDEELRVMGFSTQEVYQSETAGGPVKILFSGDTVVAPSHWGSQVLVKGWCEVAARVVESAGGLPCYWFLISKGYRTYLYLPLFFVNYHPNRNGIAPELGAVLEHVAQEKFSGSFDPESGLIRFPDHAARLGGGLKNIPHHRDQDPDVEFFLEMNPGFADGVELACLAPLNVDNTRGVGRRMLTQAMKRLSCPE